MAEGTRGCCRSSVCAYCIIKLLIVYNVGGSWSLLTINYTVIPIRTPFGLVIPLLQSSITRNYNRSQLFLTPLHMYTAYNHKRSWLQSLITLLHTKSPYWLNASSQADFSANSHSHKLSHTSRVETSLVGLLLKTARCKTSRVIFVTELM
jgi:hypothetical protein